MLPISLFFTGQEGDVLRCDPSYFLRGIEIFSVHKLWEKMAISFSIIFGFWRLDSSAITSCYSRVYQSLGNLIRWSDQVMLEGVNSEDKEVVNTVKGVIKAVLDGVKVWRSLAVL